MRILLVLVLAACGGARSGAGASGPPVRTATAVPAGPVQTLTRQARGPETELSGFVFDPALDCVAEKLDGTPDPARYRNELPIECGSPLFVVDARLTAPDRLAATVDDMTRRFEHRVPIAIGTATHDDELMVVAAARSVELEPFHPGDREISGTLNIRVAKLRAVVSRSTGVTYQDVERHENAFHLATPEGDADVELVLIVEKETGPLARVRVGKGSPLFATSGSLVERTQAARKKLGLSPLGVAKIGPDGCRGVPAKVAGVEVNDHSTCYSIPLLEERFLGDEVAYTPLMQENLLQPAVSVLEIGAISHEVGFRVLRKFESFTDEEGRARVLTRLREQWPELAEQPEPAGKLQAILDAWKASGQPDETADQFKPAMMEVAASWSTQPHYLVMLSTARELDGAIERIVSDVAPKAVAIAYTQARDKRGQMRHLIAVMFAMP
ncbi:MAG TPA: hypothetical protein VL326_30070 [Kofleriaceae bacterium]|nr:hypothetical protein [Kofleriaceae bacterium]